MAEPVHADRQPRRTRRSPPDEETPVGPKPLDVASLESSAFAQAAPEAETNLAPDHRTSSRGAAARASTVRLDALFSCASDRPIARAQVQVGFSMCG